MHTMCRSHVHLAAGRMDRLGLKVERPIVNSQSGIAQPSTAFDGSQMDVVTACLLHNESASYCPWRA